MQILIYETKNTTLILGLFFIFIYTCIFLNIYIFKSLKNVHLFHWFYANTRNMLVSITVSPLLSSWLCFVFFNDSSFLPGLRPEYTFFVF